VTEGKQARPIRTLLESRLERLLRERSVVVWYDESGTFRQALSELALGDVTRFTYDGSYYALRAQLEPAFAKLPGLAERPLLVYVPAAPLDRRDDVLREVAEAGAVFTDTLASLAAQALKDSGVPRQQLNQLLARPRLSLDDLDRLATSGLERDATISLLFGTAAPVEVAVRLLTDERVEEQISQRDAVSDIRRFVHERFGFSAAKSDVPTLRHTFVRYVLLTEFLAGLRQGVPAQLERVPHATDESKVLLCRDVASRLRDSERWTEFYREVAGQVERELGLAGLGLRADDLGDADTFPFQEQLLLDALAAHVEAGDMTTAQRTVAGRHRAFWTRVDPRRGAQWQVAGLAVDLMTEARRVERAVKAAPADPETIVTRYAGREGDEGWHRLDALQRELESRVATMEDEFQFAGLLNRARASYRASAGTLANRFLDAIQQRGFLFPKLPVQTDTFARVVAPRLALGKVAYFLVDALRYEMAVALVDSPPENAQAVSLSPAVSVLPSITPLGMAALLPGAEAGIAIVPLGRGGVAAGLGGETLVGSADRGRYLKTRLSEAVIDVTLGDLVGNKVNAAMLQGAQLCVVRSQEIDQAGENVAPHSALGSMSGTLFLLKRAMSRLAKEGYGEFVVAADHGYLLLHDLPEEQKVKEPQGETVLLHRRCWVGRGGVASDAFVRFRAADLGMGGDVELAFPRGLAAFKAAGGGEYMHGGLSPQECIVPIVTLTLRAASGQGGHKIDILPIKRVTNQMFYVKIRRDPVLFGGQERLRVRLAIIGKKIAGRILLADEGFSPGTDEVALTQGKETTITVQLQAPEGSGKFTVQVLDADTGRVLAAQKDIDYTLAHSLLL